MERLLLTEKGWWLMCAERGRFLFKIIDQQHVEYKCKRSVKTMTENRLLYKTQEAGKALGISNSMVRKLITQGKIQIVRLGERAVRISAAEIERVANGK